MCIYSAKVYFAKRPRMPVLRTNSSFGANESILETLRLTF